MNDVEPTRKRGRPIRFTPENQKRFLDAAKRGLPLSHCCRVIGVAYQSFCAYRNKHADFRTELERAISIGVDSRLKVIVRAARLNDWRAAAWLLERTHPQDFGAKAREQNQQIAVGVKVVLPRKDSEAVIETESTNTLAAGIEPRESLGRSSQTHEHQRS